MSARIDVVDPGGTYRVAVAELPLSVRASAGASAAIAVVSGAAGWVDAALAARDAGAAALVVADPEFAPSADVERLRRAVEIPVVIERPLLRADVAGDATEGSPGAGPRLLVADAAGAEDRRRVVTRDAVGWLRVLGGDGLRLVAASGSLASLETGTGVVVALTVAANARPGGRWLRVQSLGEIITSVEADPRSSRVTIESRSGLRVAPVRFESSARLALRRAVSALAAGERAADLDDLFADTALVERMLEPGRSGVDLRDIDGVDS